MLALLVMSSSSYAFECIVELSSSKAKVVDSEGHELVLSGFVDRLVVDQCDGLTVTAGSVRVFYADESGYPNEEKIAEGGRLAAIGGEQYAPFAFLVSQLRNMMHGDASSSVGSKRAFSQSGIDGFPSQKVLYPKKDWYFSAVGAKPASFQLLNKSGAVIMESLPSKEGVFKVDSKFIRPGVTYKWRAGNKNASFSVMSKAKSNEIKNTILEAIPNGASSQLKKMTYAAICNDYDLFFDSLMVLSSEK